MTIMETLKESILARTFLLTIISWTVLAIIFGFTDLEISKAVAQNSDTLWGNMGDEFGEAPGYGLIAIAIAILIAAAMDDKGAEESRQKLPALIIGISAFGIMVYGIIGNHFSTMVVGASIGIALIGFYIIAYNKNWVNYRTIALVILILALLNPLLFVQTTKILCGRVRFRNLGAEYAGYTAWWAPPGPASGLEGNSSFPSGHTAMGWMLLPLLFTVKRRKWEDPKKILTWIIVIGWGLFVAISRVIEGAHYASDVLFSTGAAAIIMIWAWKKYYVD